jgi:hypothetical protein
MMKYLYLLFKIRFEVIFKIVCKINFKVMVVFGVLFNTTNLAQGAMLDITFSKPDTYTDIRSAFSGPRYSIKDITSNLEKYLTRLADKLPPTYVLKMNITDIDLAGDTRGQNTRIVMQMFSPRLAFDYQLLDENNQVVLENTESIRDSSFMDNQSLRYKNEFLGYEKKLLDDWSRETFSSWFLKR